MPWLLVPALLLASPEAVWLLNVAPNPSFETGSAGRPSQWASGGDAARRERVWDGDSARTGSRSLRIGRGRGPAWWESARIPIRAGGILRLGVLARWEPGAGGARVALVWIREGREIGIVPSRPAEAKAPEEEAEGEPAESWFPAIVAAAPPPGADAVRLRLIADPGRGGIWFDDVFLGIDDPDIEVFGSQTGFHPAGLKEFVVRSRVPLMEPYAILAGTPDGGEPIRKGFEVHPLPSRTWGYFSYVMDFTDFLRPGAYAVEIRGGFPAGYEKEGERKASSRRFRISDRIYRDLARLSSGWFAPHRCGIGVPGWHGVCHADDAVLRGEGGVVAGFIEAAGGWHDGPDYAKWVDRTWPGVLALSGLERAAAAWSDPRGAALREAAWGARLLVGLSRADGCFHAGVAGIGAPAGPPERETDNRPRTGDERAVCAVSPDRRVPPAILAARAAWGLAAFAAAPGHEDPDLRGRAVRAARQALDFAMGASDATAGAVDLWGAILGAACELYRMTRDPADQDIADDAIQPILRLQHPEGWFRRADGEDGPAFDGEVGFPFVVALAEYAVVVPDGSFAGPARDALERFFAFEDRLLQATPFGVPAAYTRAEDRRLFPRLPRGANSYYAATAYAALRTEEATRNPRFLFVAERILQWILGGNPLDASLIVGAGGREPGAYATPYAAIPGHEDGRIPGGMIGGIEGGDGDEVVADAPLLTFGKGSITNGYNAAAQAWVVASFAELDRALLERARILEEVEERQRKRREGGR
ncbi:MAG: glycoside hydrolase family 9 protein [Planctomycetes bacterium]|nr:glycoside hydrolase family 9 protein [Planctomycetota bacterium]